MTDTTSHHSDARITDDWQAGAFPGMRGPSRGFVAHVVVALLALFALNYLVVTYIPFAIKGIGSSYLIFFYHFPAAINGALLYFGLFACSIAYLNSRRPVWDRRARSFAAVGFLANMVLLVTGSTWAKAAWNAWWVWSDPRLMSAAVASLIFLGYLMLQGAIEEPSRRRQVSGVYGVLAFVNVPVVHYSIQWFGQTSHPMKFDSMSQASIVQTRWYAVLAFMVLYTALYRWNYDRITRAERVEDALNRIRRIEERSHA